MTDKGFTALHNAANALDLSAARKALLEEADPNALDGDGWTPLHWAVARRDGAGTPAGHRYRIVKLLMEAGADPLKVTRRRPWKKGDYFKGENWSPLDMVREREDIEIMALLLPPVRRYEAVLATRKKYEEKVDI